MRLIADENIPLASIRLLRKNGHDIISVAEVMAGATDRAVLESANAQRRLLVTFDADFGALIFRTDAPIPPGVLYLRFFPKTPEEPGRLLNGLLEGPGLDFDGMFTVIRRSTIRQRKLPRA